MSCVSGAFATEVACQQERLTLPDTWFRPFWDLLNIAPIVEMSFPELAVSFLDYGSVLSRFCIGQDVTS